MPVRWWLSIAVIYDDDYHDDDDDGNAVEYDNYDDMIMHFKTVATATSASAAAQTATTLPP